MPRHTRKVAAIASALAVLATFPPGGSPAQAVPPTTPAPPATGASDANAVTLITGDVVTVSAAGGGRFAASVEPGAGREGITFHTLEVDGGVRVVPEDAVPYISNGTLDMDLFEVSSLLEDGYGNADRDDLPLIVEYGAGARSALQAQGVRRTHALPSIGGGALTVAHDHANDLWTSIAGDPSAAPTARAAGFGGGIERVWLDGKVHASLDQSTGQIGAPAAWELGLDGSGVDVAVLDTGLDQGHPDFAGRTGSTRDFTENGSVQDGHGHGTHVAGTILGAGRASEPSRRGVAPGAQLMVGKVLDDAGSGQESWIIDGMEWAVATGAEVVNMSLGGGPGSDGTDPMSMAVDRLSEQSDALFVIAAGNDGFESSIGSPGNASRALTVGAVDRNGDLADFSSRGPRLGDLAIKPEMTAPGVRIVAPRASGTYMGAPVDDFYTAASGTSMATPHVAGAAAILLQQHPGWGGQRLKAALVSSAVRNPDLQPFEQGNGELRVDRAVTQPVGGDGVLNLGKFAENDTAPVSLDTDYVNTSGQDITLDLAVDIENVRTGEPENDAVTLDRGSVVVPADGTATVTVLVDPARLSRGRHAGYLTATGADGIEASTALGTALLPPTHRVTLQGIGIHGEPTPVPWITLFGGGDTMDVITMIDNRAGTITLELMEDTYALGALIDHGAPLDEQAAYLVDPELEVDRDMTVMLDARDAHPIRIETPRPSEQQGVLSYYSHQVTDSGRDIGQGVMHFSSTQRVNVTPTQPLTSGEFEFSSRWQLVAPMVTTLVDGVPGTWDINLLSSSPTFERTRTWPLAYGGTGTPEELAGVAGKVVIVEGGWDLVEGAQIAAAADAGAAALLIVRPADFSAWTEWDPTGERLPLPALVVAHDDGQELLAKAKTGTSVLSLALETASPYLYDVMDVRHDVIPDQIVHEVTAVNSARIEASYADMGGLPWAKEQRFGWRPWQEYAWNDRYRTVPTPHVRTEWVSAGGDSLWQHRVDHEYSWSWGPVEFGLVGPVKRYAVGTGQESWFSPVVRPAAPGTPGAPVSTRTAGDLSLRIPELVDAQQNYGYLQGQPGEAAHLTVRRDGVLLGEADSGRLDVDTTPGRADYQVVLTTSRSTEEWTSATRTETDWRFTSQAPAGGTSASLPMLQADYQVGQVRGAASGKAKLLLELAFREQNGAVAPVKTVAVSMSLDGGASWAAVSSERLSSRGFKAVLLVGRAPTVSLRVVAATADGRELRQTVIDAVRLR